MSPALTQAFPQEHLAGRLFFSPVNVSQRQSLRQNSIHFELTGLVSAPIKAGGSLFTEEFNCIKILNCAAFYFRLY
jgi:hypothetical protein